MNNKTNQQVLIGGAILYRDNKNKKQYLIVKNKEGDGWEFPKVTVRKGESSVRAVIRVIGEQMGISPRVLEEVGRSTATVNLNGKSVSQKYYYYLVMQRSANGEILGFNDFTWLDYSQVSKKLSLKRDKDMFRDTKAVLKEWEKTKKHRIEQEEEELLLQEEAEAAERLEAEKEAQ